MLRPCALLIILPLVASAAPVNLLTNPGFEQGLHGWSVGFGAGAEVDREVFRSGRASARLEARGATAAIDADPLIVGYDIAPGQAYRVSAWIRSGGVERGFFAGRVYCYGPEHEVLAMYSFGNVSGPAPAGGWRQATLELAPGTRHAIPEGTATVVVRFSAWEPEQQCTGLIWVDDVEFGPVGEGVPGAPPDWLRRSEAGTALVLADDLPAIGAPAAPQVLAGLLEAEGLAVNLVSAEQLGAPGALNPRWVDLVVLPQGGAFPADARDAFVDYVRYGGSFITLGGLPFETFFRRVDGEWMDVTTVVTDADAPFAIADFEGEARPEWDLGHAGERERMAVEYTTPGAGDTATAARLRVADLQGFAYAGLADAAAPDAEHSVLSFRARGDEHTRQLCIEPREQDGSRWKMVVPLTEQWRQFEIPARRFLAYDSEGRGGPDDPMRPEQVTGVWFGFTRGMVGAGERTVWLDEVQWRRPVREAGAVPAPIRADADADLTLAAFGSHIPSAPAPDATIPVFSPLRRFEDAAQLRLVALDGTLTGRFSGHLATAPLFVPRDTGGRDVRIGGPRAGRLVPLLEARDRDDNLIGAAAAMYLPARPAQRGAVWAFSGVDNVDLLGAAPEGSAAALQRVARAAVGAPMIEAADLTFLPDEDQARAELTVSLRGRVPQDGNLRLRVRAVSGGQQTGEAVEAVEGGPVTLHIPGLAPTLREWRLDVALLYGDRLADHKAITMDARAAFLELIEWLVERQTPEGLYQGIGFEDNRAARGVLGAYEITGDERFRESAIRWGEETIRQQREDGGYRMGYGITSRGEACYVADGGEIAVAMARITSYVTGEQRERFVNSLRGYMAYREDFRQPSGAIGVGWCLHDYSKRPIEPLEEPTRIYAGETNQYTIGCTLAAAAAYATITGDPDDLAMALRDTNWLLENYTSLSGAASESAIWAHEFIADEELKRRIEAHMRDSFVKRITRPEDRSWLGGGGRSVFDLDPITFWLERVEAAPAMEAAFGRWLHALCGSNSTSAARHLMALDAPNQAERRFLCFLAVALSDAVEPLVSMRPL